MDIFEPKQRKFKIGIISEWYIGFVQHLVVGAHIHVL